MTTTDDRIRALFPNVGNTYYVDAQNGQDAAGRGDYANPLLTIQYAIDNYVTAYNNDLVICRAPNNTDFNVNGFQDGLHLNKATTTLLGIDFPVIHNSAEFASNLCVVSGDNCRVLGFNFSQRNGEATNPDGIEVQKWYCQIGSKEFPNRFTTLMHYGIKLTTESKACTVRHNYIKAYNGIEVESNENVVERNTLRGESTAPYYGIRLYDNVTDNVVMYNDVANFSKGIYIKSGCRRNTISKNTLSCYTTGCLGTNIEDENSKSARYNHVSKNDVGPLWFSGVKRIPGNVLTTTLYDETTSGIPYKDNVTRTWWISFTPSRLFSSGTHTATITFKEYSDTGTYIGKNEQTIPVGTQCPVGAPSNTVFFSSKNTMKIDITLDGLTGSDVDVTVIASADTVG